MAISKLDFNDLDTWKTLSRPLIIFRLACYEKMLNRRAFQIFSRIYATISPQERAPFFYKCESLKIRGIRAVAFYEDNHSNIASFIAAVNNKNTAA